MNHISQLNSVQPESMVSETVRPAARADLSFARQIIIPVSVAVGIILIFFLLAAFIIAMTHLNVHTQERLTTFKDTLDQLTRQETSMLGAIAESITI